MGPMDYARGDSMTTSDAIRRRVAETETRLREALPGWECWPIGTWDNRTTWSAQPDGARGAVIDGQPSVDDLIKAVRKYEFELPKHIEGQRRRLAECPDTGYGRDKAAVIQARITALERLQAARQADEGQDDEGQDDEAAEDDEGQPDAEVTVMRARVTALREMRTVLDDADA